MQKGVFLAAFLALTLTACSDPAKNNVAPAPSPSNIPLYPMKKNGKWGYINAQCQMIIPPQFNDAEEFSEGLARADNAFIDESGKPVINLMPLLGRQIGVGRKFNAGVVAIKGTYGQVTTGMCGLMNKQGQVEMLPYSSIDDFSGGLAAVLTREGAGYINPSGHMVISPRLNLLTHECGDGLCAASFENGLFGYMDYAGKTVIEPQFHWAHGFSEGLARVSVVNRGRQSWGYIDKYGSMVVANQFDEADEFSEGLAAVKKNDLWGFVDKNGLMAVEPLYPEQPGRFHGGLAKVLLNGNVAYIDTHGHYVCTSSD